MPGFTSYDSIIAALSAGQYYDRVFNKIGNGVASNGNWFSYWKQGGCPAAGADPAGAPGGTTYTGAVTGAMQFPDQTASQKHLLRAGAYIGGVTSYVTGLLVYDRLRGVSGLSLASGTTTALTNTVTPRFAAKADGVCMALEITTASTGTPSIAVSYLDQDGNAGVTPDMTVPALAAGHLVWPLDLAAGDSGVRALTQFELKVAGGGVTNLLLIRPLVILSIGTWSYNERDLVMQLASLPRIEDGACLGLALLGPAAGAMNITGQLGVAYA
jgi:hypothetical protein